MFNEVICFIRSLYGEGFIPLHEPKFIGNEKKYLNECIDSTFVSSVGKFVDKLEEDLCRFTGSKFAVATMSGTAALHMALILADVDQDDEVITQALTFVATANAISYQRAYPIFLDSAPDNLGLCPDDLKAFLTKFADVENGVCFNKKTGRKIKACVPMHVFGHPVKLNEIIEICNQYNIIVIEDAAESLGSTYKGRQTGTIAPIGIVSFNGNKIVTSGGGGAILIQDESLAKKAKHLTTTAKVSHKWEFYHDQIGYNYRLPNLNAALICAQLEKLPEFIKNKKDTASKYKTFFSKTEIEFVESIDDSNYWLNAVKLKDKIEKNKFLEELNSNEIMSRPIWKLMIDLPAFSQCYSSELNNAKNYEETVVNLPSSVRLKNLIKGKSL
jgi:aminotransferase in exopolysaccharide biosynthesis